MVEFRDYQLEAIDKSYRILKNDRFIYLSMQVRTGKTLTSLGICQKMIVNNVVFITKKKAMPDVVSDYSKLSPDFELEVINYESMHKIKSDRCDILILDEAHSLGAFPKPSKRARQVKEFIRKHDCMVILMSGTPTPESYSQMYHQLYGIPSSPFSEYKNFYRFADDHVKVVTKKINGLPKNDYSDGLSSIMDCIEPYKVSYTQEEAGFDGEVEEEVIYVDMKDKTYIMCNMLKKDLVIKGKDEVILADTGVKLMMKLHQMYSGTIKFESGNSMVLDTTKAEYIKWRFKGSKIGIFYKFKAELDALVQVLGDDICTDLETFNSTDKNIALQIVSGREGISLRNAEYIVFYNIDFSATSYWQARDRMTTKDRKYNKVYWIFSSKGIERKIYKTVMNKKNFTLKHFYERTKI